MNELLFVLVSGFVSFVTEKAKQHLPGINPLFILALISLFFGGIYIVLSKFTGSITIELTKIWGTAIVVYNLMKEVKKIK